MPWRKHRKIFAVPMNNELENSRIIAYKKSLFIALEILK